MTGDKEIKILTKEEIGYKTTDKLRKMWLLNPHDHHMLYVRVDGSFYGFTHMKGEDPEEWFWEAHGIQTELFPPEPPKSHKFTQEQLDRAPHHNILEKYAMGRNITQLNRARVFIFCPTQCINRFMVGLLCCLYHNLVYLAYQMLLLRKVF